MTNRGRQLLEDENVLTITCHCDIDPGGLDAGLRHQIKSELIPGALTDKDELCGSWPEEIFSSLWSKKDIVIQDLLHIHKDARLNPLALEVYRRDDTTSGVSTTNWSWPRGQADKVWAVVASEDMILCWNIEGLGLERDVLDRATEVIAEGGGIELSWEAGGLKVGRCGYIIMKYTTFVKPSGWWRSPFPLDGYSLWLYPSHDVDSEGYLINLVKTPLWDCVTLSEQAM